MVESSFPDEDPVLFESASAYHRARISRARDPLFDAMQSLLAAREEGGGRWPDLNFSRTFSAWIGALLKVERGLDPICLDGEAFERHLAAESPHQGLAKVSVPFELVDGSVAVYDRSCTSIRSSRTTAARCRWCSRVRPADARAPR